MTILKEKFLVFVFVFVFVFQISVIPDTLDLKIYSRVGNAFFLFFLLFFAFFSLQKNSSKRLFFGVSLSCSLIVLGYVINFLLSMSIETIGQLGKLIPWLAMLAIPFINKDNPIKYWVLYYKLVVFFTVIGVFEYAAIFVGIISPVAIETQRGMFYKGFLTILHYLEDGGIYYRYYGVFQEPGTAAMFMLPAIIYALIHSKWLGFILLIAATVLTFSLGGYFSILVSIGLFLFWKSSGRPAVSFFMKMVIVISTLLMAAYFFDDFIEEYEKKQESASVREDNVIKFISNLDVLVKYPFGFVLEGNTLSELSETSEDYMGSNFSFYVAFVQGGLLGLLGYTLFFLMNVKFLFKCLFKKHNSSRLYACVTTSLPGMLLFCFQRTTILETALFAFLYLIPIIGFSFLWNQRAKTEML